MENSEATHENSIDRYLIERGKQLPSSKAFINRKRWDAVFKHIQMIQACKVIWWKNKRVVNFSCGYHVLSEVQMYEYLIHRNQICCNRYRTSYYRVVIYCKLLNCLCRYIQVAVTPRFRSKNTSEYEIRFRIQWEIDVVFERGSAERGAYQYGTIIYNVNK